MEDSAVYNKTTSEQSESVYESNTALRVQHFGIKILLKLTKLLKLLRVQSIVDVISLIEKVTIRICTAK